MHPREPSAPAAHSARRASSPRTGGFGRRRAARAGLLALAVAAAAGCRLPWTGLGNDLRVESTERPVVLAPAMTHRVYSSTGPNNADLYITDVDPARLAPDRSLTGVTGSLLHLHMFVEPRPGRTPIETTALSATARLIVAAEGEVGVYEGAGFLLPDNGPTGDRFSGAVRGGTLRLTASTPGFVDRLGTSQLELSFAARRDTAVAGVIDQAVEDFVWRATSFPQPAPEPQAEPQAEPEPEAEAAPDADAPAAPR